MRTPEGWPSLSIQDGWPIKLLPALKRRAPMMDVLFVLATLTFVTVAISYVHFLEKLPGKTGKR
jgi:hypothetical protein